MINKYGEVKVILKNKKGHNPFEGIDILIKLDNYFDNQKLGLLYSYHQEFSKFQNVI